MQEAYLSPLCEPTLASILLYGYRELTDECNKHTILLCTEKSKKKPI